MTLCVMISCMHQQDMSIIERSNVQTNVVVINQCDKDNIERFEFTNKKGCKCKAVFVNTTERGLSRSRNMAIKYAEGDICLVCDDDEWLDDDYEDKILAGYSMHPKAGVIAFGIRWEERKYPVRPCRVNLVKILQISSLQISFNKNRICDRSIKFDELMGSGTGNGGGEENKFLYDCRKAGLEIWYEPALIATVNKGESQWFNGFVDKYFENHGWSARRLLGDFGGFIYCIYYVIAHMAAYKNDNTFWNALKCELRGYNKKIS